MIIICNGGYRTGSTLTFNICVKLFNGKASIGGANNAYLNKFIKDHNPKEYHIFKSHDFMPETYNPNLKIIHSYRHPFQVAASNVTRHLDKGNFFITEKDNDYIIKTVKGQKDNLLRLINRKDTLTLNYDLLVTKLEECIRKTADHLDIYVTKENVIKIKKELSIQNIKEYCKKIENADPKTQLRKNHIGKYEDRLDYWIEVLPNHIIERIIQEFGEDYIKSFGKQL